MEEQETTAAPLGRQGKVAQARLRKVLMGLASVTRLVVVLVGQVEGRARLRRAASTRVVTAVVMVQLVQA